MKTTLIFLLLLFAFGATAQVSDQFTDGDFTASPTWSGTNADFIVNAGGELQINNTVAATSYLSLPHGLATLDGQEWSIKVRQTFAPSSSNFGRVYLTATAADLSTNPDGFYIQLGEANATDAVRLFKIVGGVSTQICASPDGQIAASFAVGIRVLRDAAGNWQLFVDPTGGTNYGTAYTGTDATVILGTHFGVLGTYTLSNATKFFFDNVYVGPEIIDTQAPTLVSATAISATQVDVLFSEPVAGAQTSSPSNYALNPATTVASATIDGTNGALVHLALSSNLQNGQNYQINCIQIQDLFGNTATNLQGNFSYLVSETPVKGDILINEFMADQSPVVGLPEAEFIEIYNKSNKYFDLTGWKIGDASSDGTITSGWIMPGEYKILCSSTNVDSFPGAYAVTSFPSLNNASDDIVLKTPSLLMIDKVSYSDTWYGSDLKKDGGYTLELINPTDPCSDGSNWIGSNNTNGGTPGAVNSVYDLTPDTQIPSLLASNALAPNFLELIFSEGMDSTSLATSLLTCNPALTLSSIYTAANGSTTAIASFGENLASSQLYTFTIGPVADCWLNSTSFTGSFALGEDPQVGDIVINELLFDPATNGTDFIELYNRSTKVLNLKNYEIANYDNDTIWNNKIIANNYTLFPNEFVVLTADSTWVKNTYSAAVSDRFYQMTLPSLNNDSTAIYVIFNSVVLDRVAYTSDWHLSLIDDTENKTLERIDPNGPSSEASNWHTAAETIGFGTPGARNSQYQTTSVDGDFGTTEPIFSPDNDGNQDVLVFYYQMETGGQIANLKIYDDQGRLIRNLLKSEVLGTEGNFTWDGVNDNNTKAGIGIYLAVIETFTPTGGVAFTKRIAFTLGGNLD